ICVPEPESKIHQNPQLQREGILALPETSLEGTIPMVARRQPGQRHTGSASTAVAIGRWDPAAAKASRYGDKFRRRPNGRKRDLRSRMRVATVAANGDRSEI